MSPAQRPLSRRTRTLLPMAGSLLLLRAGNTTQQRKQIALAKQNQAKHFNKSTKNLPPILEGDHIRLKPLIKGQKEWQKGTLLTCLDERSYEVETDTGGIIRRNRIHLRPTKEALRNTETSMPPCPKGTQRNIPAEDALIKHRHCFCSTISSVCYRNHNTKGNACLNIKTKTSCAPACQVQRQCVLND